MNWLIIPIEELKKFDENWEIRRTNVAGAEAIIHEEIYNELVPPIMMLNLESVGSSVSTYTYPLVNDSDLDVMLNTKEWTDDSKLGLDLPSK